MTLIYKHEYEGFGSNLFPKHFTSSFKKKNDQNLLKSKYCIYRATPQILKVHQNFPENE